MDVDRDHVEGWFSDDPREITEKSGGRWLTTNFSPGDILTFGLYTMHAGEVTRQRATTRGSMDRAREQWGVQPPFPGPNA
jgi:hypothetical protein